MSNPTVVVVQVRGRGGSGDGRIDRLERNRKVDSENSEGSPGAERKQAEASV